MLAHLAMSFIAFPSVLLLVLVCSPRLSHLVEADAFWLTAGIPRIRFDLRKEGDMSILASRVGLVMVIINIVFACVRLLA